MPLDMTQFHQVFFDETAEHLSTMESLLLYLDPEDPDQLDDLSRAAHSIKGSGGTFGFREMANLAQEIEAVIGWARKGSGRLSAERVGALREACEALWALLAGYRGDGAADTEAHDAAAQAIALLRGHATGRRGENDGAGARADPTRVLPPAPDPKASLRETPKALDAAAGDLCELARRTATASNEVMALVEAAGAGNLRDVTEAVRGLGEAIERNAALAERAAENADVLRDALRALVQSIAGMALSSRGSRAASARPRPLPKVRRAAGGAEAGKEWPEF